MAGAPKNLAQWAVLMKPEVADGTYLTPSASTDAILVVERPDIVTDWMNKGERGHPSLKNVGKSGRFHTTTLVHEPAGAGAAYATGKLPSVYPLARVCGLDATLVTTSGAESCTFTPASIENIISESIEAYVRGQKYQLTGAHGQFSLEAELGGIPRFSADISAISKALPLDSAFPAVTYAGSQIVDPAKAEAMSLLIGTWAPLRVTAVSLKQDRGINPRYFDVVNGLHGGFQPSATPTYKIEVTVESEALATYNPYSVAELATSAAFSATFGGGTTYKKHTLAAANMQLDGVPEQDNNNVAVWNLAYSLKPSTPFGVDYFSWAFVK